MQRSFKELREKKRYTSTDIAKELKVSRAAIYFWDQGTTRPRLNKITQLAALLEVSTEELIKAFDETLSRNKAEENEARDAHKL